MKILYVATMLSHICQFHLPYLQMLQEQGHEVHVAAHDNLAVKNGLQLKYADRHIDIPFERSPYDPRNIAAYRELKALIEQEHYDLIVCNTPVGGILARLAARSSRKNGTRVIYIAHGFHFYKGASKRNWAMFYPLEKRMARLCDVVVTINEEDYQLARAHFPGEVAHIHGIGANEERFHPASAAEQAEMRRKEGLSETAFVVICTGELNDNKDQKTLIDAAALLKEQIPELKILLAGNGPKEQALRERIAEKGLGDTVQLIGYRADLEKLVPAVDVVVSCSKREGLPLNIVEAMLCEKPVVASINRGNAELVEDGVTGYLVGPGDAVGCADRILSLRQSGTLSAQMGEAGHRRAENYTTRAVKKELAGILSNDAETERRKQ
ncbi:MAG: glycosyltransferase family 4 protein [Firmicutes bacterium]|nr:glycosyltransferase family 4 protein [Bacillota bacterium]